MTEHEVFRGYYTAVAGNNYRKRREAVLSSCSISTKVGVQGERIGGDSVGVRIGDYSIQCTDIIAHGTINEAKINLNSTCHRKSPDNPKKLDSVQTLQSMDWIVGLRVYTVGLVNLYNPPVY